MNTTITVLMYHAVGDERGACAGAESPYVATSRQFDSHLALTARAGLRVRSVADLLAAPADRTASVAFTFDARPRQQPPGGRTYRPRRRQRRLFRQSLPRRQAA